MSLRFAHPHEIDDRFGGKAAGLARLASLGARVPPFFAVEPTATPPSAWDDDDRREFLRRAAEILARGRVAVRSSAIGEDGHTKSFAGLFDTVLGVSEAQSALAAAARCISSGHGARATLYAGANGAIPVGVVCQLQVEARSAGVCFTRDPSGRDSAIVIEAVPGMGDRLVSGAADPERWRVYRNGLGAWEAYREAMGTTTLVEEEAIATAREAAEIAARVGHPLDLEWALDAQGTLWWLQARPITAAAPLRSLTIEKSCPEADDGPVTVWSNWNIRETMPDPLLPLVWSLWRDVFMRLMVRSTLDLPRSSPLYRHLAVFDRVQGRVYWNMNTLLAVPGFGWMARIALPLVDHDGGRLVEQVLDRGVLRPRRLPGSWLSLVATFLRTQATSIVHTLVAFAPRRLLRRLELWGESERARATRPISELSDEELIAEFRHFEGSAGKAFVGILNVMGVAMGFYWVATHAFRHAPEAARLLVAGLTTSPTTRISIEIDELTEAARPIADRFAGGTPTETLARLREDPSARAWIAELDRFLDRFGQRCPKEFDLAVPRWIEDPSMIVELVRAGLKAPSGERVRAGLARLAERRRTTIETAIATAPWWKRPLLRWLVWKVEEHIPLREAPKHHMMRGFLRMRQAAIELGRRYSERGAIPAAGDIFFLELAEIESLVRGDRPPPDLPARIASRRAELARFEAEPPPDCIRSDGVPALETRSTPSDPSVLRGTPVSSGRASGRARLMRVPDPSRIEEGDILVVELADPGWTPLFPRVRALVMEVGGLMCHAACVARELGVPSVFGVRGAMTALHDDDPITVDGDAGTVVRDCPPSRQPVTCENHSSKRHPRDIDGAFFDGGVGPR